MNNKGAMRFEFITIVALLIIILCGGMVMILNGASSQKIDTMKDNALNFAHIAAGNTGSFLLVEKITLAEVIDEGLIKDIKNPLGSGYCDRYNSKVIIKDGYPFVTLKCGNYLIDDIKIDDKNDVKVYKVSDWSVEKLSGDDVESAELYTCSNIKEYKDSYFDEYGLLAKINIDNGSSYYSLEDANDVCEIEKNTFYRKKNYLNK